MRPEPGDSPSAGPLVRSEIAEQPAVAQRVLDALAPVRELAARVRAERPRYVVIAARGSSDNVARYAQHLIGRFWGIPVALASPSLQSLYGARLSYRGALVLGISQSGASPDVVGVLAAARDSGALTAAVTNDERSPLAATSQFVLPLRAGPERAVAATKTFTASLTVIAALVAVVRQDSRLLGELASLPELMVSQLALEVEASAAQLDAEPGHLVVLGRGAHLATAFEAALKVRELAGIAAEGWSTADFLHGPIAAVGAGTPALVVATSGPAFAQIRQVMEILRRRGARVTVLTDRPRSAIPADVLVALVEAPEWLSPCVAVLPAQRLAIGIAERLGRDADHPDGLQKVTLTT